MAKTKVAGGTKEQPWQLKTASGQSEFEAYRDATLSPPALVVKVGKTELRYHLRCVEDLHAMLKQHGDWMLMSSADEPAGAGSPRIGGGRAQPAPQPYAGAVTYSLTRSSSCTKRGSPRSGRYAGSRRSHRRSLARLS